MGVAVVAGKLGFALGGGAHTYRCHSAISVLCARSDVKKKEKKGIKMVEQGLCKSENKNYKKNYTFVKLVVENPHCGTGMRIWRS